MAVTLVTIKQKVGFIYFRGRKKIKIFCSWKEKMVTDQSMMEVRRMQKDRLDSVSELNSVE